MDPEETMVEEEYTEVAEDDALPEDLVEEGEPEESLDEFIEENEEPEEEQPAEEPRNEGPKEPGWIKKRVSDAVEKAVARTRAEMQAMFDQQMAPIRQKMMEDEAQELVRSRKVADIETARELVRLRNGQPAAQQQPVQEQPRNDKGQFKSEQTVRVEARIDELKKQADYIKDQTGIDVVKEYQNNPEIERKVIMGEMDFYQVADYIRSRQTKKKPPAPTRSPNGASGSEKSTIANMTDEQFERFEKKVSGGARFSVR